MDKISKRLEVSQLNEDMLFLSEIEFDEALIGYVEGCNNQMVALYDRTKCIEVLVEMGMTWEDAVEHFEYNIIGSYMGENTPLFATLHQDM